MRHHIDIDSGSAGAPVPFTRPPAAAGRQAISPFGMNLAREESNPGHTVFVVDGDVSVREGLEALIGEAGWQPRVFASGQAFLDHARVFAPSCLILDVSPPDFSGLALQREIASQTEIPIIVISGHDDIPLTVQAMKAGAVEFLTKPFDDVAILSAISDAIEISQRAFARELKARALRERHALLSRREQEVMLLVASGLMNKQVGGRLGISEITVKAHRGRVMRKMRAGSLADLVNMAATLRLARESMTRRAG